MEHHNYKSNARNPLNDIINVNFEYAKVNLMMSYNQFKILICAPKSFHNFYRLKSAKH